MKGRFRSWDKTVIRNALILSDHRIWSNHCWFLTYKLKLISCFLFVLFCFQLLLSSLLGPVLPIHDGMGASSFSFQSLTWLVFILSEEWRGSSAWATLAAGWYSKGYTNMLIFKSYVLPCQKLSLPCSVHRTLDTNGEKYPCCVKVLRQYWTHPHKAALGLCSFEIKLLGIPLFSFIPY